MTHADAHRSERIRRVPKSMLPPRSSGPVTEGRLPLSSRWHRSGNLLEPVGPGELAGHQAGPRRSGTGCVAGLALRMWAGCREATEVTGARGPGDRLI